MLKIMTNLLTYYLLTYLCIEGRNETKMKTIRNGRKRKKGMETTEYDT